MGIGKDAPLMSNALAIAMLSIHSSPIGILGTRDTGGMSVYVRSLAREMGRTGHRVDIFTRAREDSDAAETRLSTNVRLVTLDIGGPQPLEKADLHRHADDFAARNASMAAAKSSA